MSGAHERYEELLAAFADGGLKGDEEAEVRRHVDACAACTQEVEALRGVLAAARRAQVPVPAKDDVFFNDLARDVRRAVAGLPPPRSLLGFLRRPVVIFGFCAAAAGILALVYVRNHPAQEAPSQMAVKPAVKPATPGGPVGVPPIDDEEDLTAAQAEKVLAALDPVEDDAPASDEEALLEASRPENVVETLDSDELARVDARL